jgi:pimeloyl-ACP methyl ester carboxylesterase
MNKIHHIGAARGATRCVIALHCSLASGRQWARLAQELGSNTRLIAPDISGYGNSRDSIMLPTTLAGEIAMLGEQLREAEGPFHLIGHSYGGAIAFKLATQSSFAKHVRSLTLIEPVLPTLLGGDGADRRLYRRFDELARGIQADLWKGLSMEAIDKFMLFWNGSAPPEKLSPEARLRLIEHADKLAFDLAAAFAEQNVAAAASGIGVPTLLFSGGLSPYLTQRIAERLASLIPDVDARHLLAAGHMMPFTHAKLINPEIAGHMARADDLAGVSLASSLEATTPEWTRELGRAQK